MVVTKTKACKPTPGEPEGYIDRGYWMEERYNAGWRQKQCPKCKLWHIWIPPPKARKQNRKG